ncbi:MAG: hypothetical protein A2W27_10990 [Deltaproteobacteria bacterium RBG_16_44_11]|nr:MAG: hypothetical protein A2W27_10990 [Deltaproteobacteria bacterium RBG_16_44_11]
MSGWVKIKPAARYAGISERTMRDWLKDGLVHSRLPSGTILIRYEQIDQFLKQYEAKENKVDQIVNDTLRELG